MAHKIRFSMKRRQSLTRTPSGTVSFPAACGPRSARPGSGPANRRLEDGGWFRRYLAPAPSTRRGVSHGIVADHLVQVAHPGEKGVFRSVHAPDSPFVSLSIRSIGRKPGCQMSSLSWKRTTVPPAAGKCRKLLQERLRLRGSRRRRSRTEAPPRGSGGHLLRGDPYRPRAWRKMPARWRVRWTKNSEAHRRAPDR